MEEILKFLEKTKINKYEELLSCLELERDTLQGISKELSNEYVKQLLENKKFEEAKNTIEYIEKVDKKVKEIDKLLENTLVLDEDTKEDVEITNVKDYEKYRVDETEKHNLYEIFRNKRPCAFVIENQRIEANSWKEILIDTCNYLSKKDNKLFQKIVDEEKIKGKKRILFSLSSNGMFKAEKLSYVEGYVETNLSADSIKNLIKRLLKEFDIPVAKYWVYLRADYTNMNE